MSAARARFGVLGPLEVHLDGALVPIGGPKQRTALAVLLLEPGRVVAAERIAECIWGEELPERWSATLQVYVYNLRRALRGSDCVDSDDGVLLGRRPGYAVEADAATLDLLQLEELTAQARERRDAGDGAAAAHLYRLALSLWRGPTLADLVVMPRVAALTVPIERRRTHLMSECFDLELALGRHRQLLPELEAACAAEPLDERLAGQLVVALYRAGRQADALVTYRRTARRLVEELGIDPGPDLRSLEAAVLRQDPSLDLPAPAADPGVTLQRDDRGLRGAVLVLPNGVELELAARTWLIGRHPDCQVVLADPEASRRHAEVRPVPGGYVLVDLASTNGTRVGDREVREHRLEDGDRIGVGTTTLVFRAG
ncbi:MAG TPA: BTAD domain-containing putative transcriptional regulator [Actinomycetes bacterium]|nr:BTAD domain-containing putative transcriptional regulator [Actinomycetes bacterium]